MSEVLDTLLLLSATHTANKWMEVVDLQQPQHETAHSGSHTTEPGKGQVISHGTLSAQWHLPSAVPTTCTQCLLLLSTFTHSNMVLSCVHTIYIYTYTHTYVLIHTRVGCRLRRVTSGGQRVDTYRDEWDNCTSLTL